MVSAKLTRRAMLAQAAAFMGSAALAEAPLTAKRPEPRPDALPPGRPGIRLRARPSPEDFVTEARLGGNVGYVLADAGSGAIVEARQAETPLMPASVTKSVTALYALDALGADHRFYTHILATGPVLDGVLDGDLILAGGGDPVLDTDGLAALLARLREAGVERVTGRFLVYGGALPELREIEPGQLPHLGYNPAVSGLNLNFNRVHFEWRQQGGSYSVRMDARTALYRPEVRVARMAVIDRSTPVYTYEDGGDHDRWTVARRALGTGGTRWLPVRRPEIYAAEVFRALASGAGLSLPAPERIETLPAATEVVRIESPPLDEIIRGMLRFSTNLTAEVIGLAATQARGVQPADLAASALVMRDWLVREFGISPDFADHSGLSDASRISAAEMVTILTAPGTQARLEPLLRDIPMRDQQGTPYTDPPGEVLAKTGTLNFVSTLAGYLRSDTGRVTAFAIFTGNEDLRAEAKGSPDEVPSGARGWNSRSKTLQQRLLVYWAGLPPRSAAPAPEAQAGLLGVEPDPGNPSLFVETQ